MVKNLALDRFKNLSKRYNREELEPTPREAGVLLPFVYNGSCLDILLTKRRDDLNSHAGEVSFPGGMKDPEDNCLMETALRETDEELGLKLSSSDIFATLDDEISKSGHRVTPYAAFINEKSLIVPNECEVAKIYRIPVKFFITKETYWSEFWIRNNERHKVHFYRYQEDIIWGLTARILFKFFSVIGEDACS